MTSSRTTNNITVYKTHADIRATATVDEMPPDTQRNSQPPSVCTKES